MLAVLGQLGQTGEMMFKRFQFLFGFLVVTLIAGAVASADVLDDGDFELTGGPWVTSGAAFQDATNPGIDPLVEGSQTLRMLGNFEDSQNFSIAFQDIAIDGTDFSIGDEIVLTGIGGHTSANPLSGQNVAFIEVVFTTPFGELGGGLNTSMMFDSTTATDQYFDLITPVLTVANAQTIRVKAVFSQQADFATGEIWFDNLVLTNLSTAVPEPGTTSFVAIGLIGLLVRRRRK